MASAVPISRVVRTPERLPRPRGIGVDMTHFKTKNGLNGPPVSATRRNAREAERDGERKFGINIFDSSNLPCYSRFMEPVPQTLIDAVSYFKNLDNCIDYLANRRWPKGVTCPTCGRADVSYVASRRLWQCRSRHAKAQFSVKTGTIIEESLLGLDKWMPVIWMVANCKNGVSSWEIHRALGVTQKTAWFMLHRIRLGMQTAPTDKFGGSGGEVESDETFVGGKARNMHKSRRAQFKAARESAGPVVGQAAHLVNKTTVWGILDREQRRVRATVVPKVNREALQIAVLNHVAHGAKVYTDEAAV